MHASALGGAGIRESVCARALARRMPLASRGGGFRTTFFSPARWGLGVGECLWVARRIAFRSRRSCELPEEAVPLLPPLALGFPRGLLCLLLLSSSRAAASVAECICVLNWRKEFVACAAFGRRLLGAELSALPRPAARGFLYFSLGSAGSRERRRKGGLWGRRTAEKACVRSSLPGWGGLLCLLGLRRRRSQA